MYLRQSTAVTLIVGPLVDATDGFTAETAVALAAGEADLYKHDSATRTDISGRAWTHIAGGVYSLALVAGDTDTPGQLVVVIRDSAHRPFRLTYMVVPSQVYDSLTGADLLQVDVRETGGSTAALARQQAGAMGLVTGTVGTGSTTTLVTTDLTEATNDHYNGRTITFTSGALDGQAAAIQDYAGATRTLTVTALTEAPASGTTFVIA
jgi:hypothetical protein